MEEAIAIAASELAKKANWNGCGKPKKRLTNAYLVQGSRVLLGYKKRGFGEGKVNGFGGKVDESRGESVYKAALREMEEESGLQLLDAKCVGVLLYDYPTKESTMEVFVYKAMKYQGTITESDEMDPRWVEKGDIDYNEMWADDPYWLMKLFALDLDSNVFIGWFDFSEDMNSVKRCQVQDVKRTELG